MCPSAGQASRKTASRIGSECVPISRTKHPIFLRTHPQDHHPVTPKFQLDSNTTSEIQSADASRSLGPLVPRALSASVLCATLDCAAATNSRVSHHADRPQNICSCALNTRLFLSLLAGDNCTNSAVRLVIANGFPILSLEG